MKKLKVGVIGVGYLGQFHAEKYSRMNGVELVGVVDADISRSKKIAEKFHTTAFKHHSELFGKVDAVSVVVSTPAHFAVGIDCIENGMDVFIEKPITTVLHEADELIKAAESKNRIIQVGHIERFNPAMEALEKVIEKPIYIEAHRLGVFTERGSDVSVILDLMIHDIDLILSFLKTGPEEIRASGASIVTDHIDIANARLEFKNGCVANIIASRIATRNERKLKFFQKDAYITADLTNHAVNIIRYKNKKATGKRFEIEKEKINLSKGDALDDELNAFVKSVKTRKDPEVNGAIGREALGIALEIMSRIDKSGQKHING